MTAQQCLLNKDTIWLRDRPVFASPNDASLDVSSCHQSLLHGESMIRHVISGNRFISLIFQRHLSHDIYRKR